MGTLMKDRRRRRPKRGDAGRSDRVLSASNGQPRREAGRVPLPKAERVPHRGAFPTPRIVGGAPKWSASSLPEKASEKVPPVKGSMEAFQAFH